VLVEVAVRVDGHGDLDVGVAGDLPDDDDSVARD